MAGPDPDFVATIYANNQRFTAWDSVMVLREFGTGISQFQFSAAEAVYGRGARSLQISPGTPVTIALAGQLAFTGYCTTRGGGYDKKSHQIVIAGDSQTVDLANSSVQVQPGTLDGSTFEQAAQSVLAPHNIRLVMANAPDGASQPFKNLTIQYGESVAEFISRIAAMRNLFITDNAQGQLVAGQASPNATSSATLVEGKNIERATFKLVDPSASSRSKLTGVSQTPGSDDTWPSRAFAATASYAAARPNLFGLFVADHPSDAQELVTHVTHEAIRSLWPEIDIDVTVPGWWRPDGKLWAPAPDAGAFASLYSPSIFPDQADPSSLALLAIQAVRFGQDSENGTTTTLTLRRREALTSAATAGVGESGSSGAAPSVSADAPDYQTST